FAPNAFSLDGSHTVVRVSAPANQAFMAYALKNESAGTTELVLGTGGLRFTRGTEPLTNTTRIPVFGAPFDVTGNVGSAWFEGWYQAPCPRDLIYPPNVTSPTNGIAWGTVVDHDRTPITVRFRGEEGSACTPGTITVQYKGTLEIRWPAPWSIRRAIHTP